MKTMKTGLKITKSGSKKTGIKMTVTVWLAVGIDLKSKIVVVPKE